MATSRAETASARGTCFHRSGSSRLVRARSQAWHRHQPARRRRCGGSDRATARLSGVRSGCWLPARSGSPMAHGSSSAAGDVGVARTGSRITRRMQPSAAQAETSGPRPLRQPSSACGPLARELEQRGMTVAVFPLGEHWVSFDSAEPWSPAYGLGSGDSSAGPSASSWIGRGVAVGLSRRWPAGCSTSFRRGRARPDASDEPGLK